MTTFRSAFAFAVSSKSRRHHLKKEPGLSPGSDFFTSLLLLLALGMSLVGVLMGGLRMLLSGVRMFLALHVIALAVVLSGTAVSFSSIFVMFGGFVVFVSCHRWLLWLFAPRLLKRPGVQGSDTRIATNLYP
jgi:hypothetical protein